MDGKTGKYVMLAPVKVAIALQLQTVWMIHGIGRQPPGKLAEIETGLDFLNQRGIVQKNPVHPPIDPETISFLLEQSTYWDFGLVRGIRFRPFFLHAGVNLPTLGSCASIARMGFNAAGAWHRYRKIAERDSNEFHGCRHISL